MARRFGFRPKLRDQMLANQKSLDMYAALSGKPRIDLNIPAKRERAAPRQLEAPVVAAIAELLAVHPKVLFAVRQNSGAASFEAASGKYQPVHFYRVLTGQPVTITDFWGILRDGRVLAVEAKAPGFREPRTERELKQAAFLMLVRNAGGIGIFATSAADVASALQ